jgi:hypothetical protein
VHAQLETGAIQKRRMFRAIKQWPLAVESDAP